MKNWNNQIELAIFLLCAAVIFSIIIWPSSNKILLLRAVGNDDTNQVVNLAHKGVDINLVTGNDGKTPLMVSIIKNHQDMAKLLINLGANLSEKDSNGKTAFDYLKEAGWTNWPTIISNVNTTR